MEQNEYFHDYEARFSKEGQVQGFVEVLLILELLNYQIQSDNKYVLEQFNFDTGGFRTSVSLEPALVIILSPTTGEQMTIYIMLRIMILNFIMVILK